ncbi:MAG: hypothetical protein CMJ48_02805 [Planctomycetaceae bacterium]|nr:hypothetical protein [Planctomycetaceae bacterium]
MTTLLFAAGLVLMLLACCASLSCYALRSFSRHRLEEICAARGRPARFGQILRDAEPVLLSTELLTTGVSILAIAVGSLWIGAAPATPSTPEATLALTSYQIGEWLLFGAALLFALVVIPWSVARIAGERVLFLAWPILETVNSLARPIRSLMRRLDVIMHRLAGRTQPSEGTEIAITEEIRTVMDAGQREGLLESEARSMIHRVMELHDQDAAEVMTPRTDMNCIPASATLEEARRQLLDAGHSRVPVIGSSADDIVGILYAKDLLKNLDDGNPSPPLRSIVRKPFYVPETTGIDSLLETMKHKRVQMAIVLDEYGGVAGLVTMEDILEEIVGEIVDEYDPEEAELIHQAAANVAEVDARTHIDDLNDKCGYELPEDGDYDTVGGFVVSLLGHIPEVAEQFNWKNLVFTILEADSRKIVKLRIESKPNHATAG